MDELIEIMKDILIELQEINFRLDDIRGSGINSIDDICSKLDNIEIDVSCIALDISLN